MCFVPAIRARVQLMCCYVYRLTAALPNSSVSKDVVTILAALVSGAPTLLATLVSAAKTVKIWGYIAFHAAWRFTRANPPTVSR